MITIDHTNDYISNENNHDKIQGIFVMPLVSLIC